jgi:hypothetical protein
MRSYRLARRSFLGAVGGAIGLRVMLDNMVAVAQGAKPPPRFLMMHWPVGTVHYWFKPTGSGRDYTPSRILQPFEDAGLREDMIILYGMDSNVGNGQGGGHEAGTPMATTGAACPGTRANGGEEDDAAAGGPSFDQIFLKNVPDLQTPGVGYANAICDARVDSLETSTQCLSYGYTKRSIAAARGGSGGQIEENVPLLPELSPAQLYMQLFSNLMPGGATPGNQEAVANALVMRRSVLDYSLGELERIKSLAPANERTKIDLHAEAIRKIEMQLSQQIEDGTLSMGCEPPMAPDAALVGENSGRNGDYGRAETSSADDELHAKIGKAHAGVLKAAFQCDLIRVGTFQWSPGTNHVSFAGQYPDDPNAIYMHHPLSHDIGDRGDVMDGVPNDGRRASIVEFLANVQAWYNTHTAEILNEFKNAEDAFGGKLLDHTVIPFVTEVAETTHSWSPMPAMIFGGKALGMQGGQYVELSGGGGFGGGRGYNAMWMSVAQAYLGADPLAALSDEVFDKEDPIDGLWMPPE